MYISLISKLVVTVVTKRKASLKGQEDQRETLKGTGLKREAVFIRVTQNLCFILSKSQNTVSLDRYVRAEG